MEGANEESIRITWVGVTPFAFEEPRSRRVLTELFNGFSPVFTSFTIQTYTFSLFSVQTNPSK